MLLMLLRLPTRIATDGETPDISMPVMDGIESSSKMREFEEETGSPAPGGDRVELEPVHPPGGKTVLAWAVRGEFDPSDLRSNDFEMEWPPRSGRMARFPEIDRAAWFPIDVAETKIHEGQTPLLAQLKRVVR